MQAFNGAATFSGLTISNLGSGYTLQASSSGLTAAITAPFNVSDQLTITTAPPNTVTAGSPFGLVVTVENGPGNVDNSFNGSVTVSDPMMMMDGNTLRGTLTVTAVNGVATFSGLTLTQANSMSELAVNAGGLPTVDTNWFTVTGASATQLAVATPSGVVPNGPFNLTVNAEDQFGNIASTFNGSVTLALASNAAAATLGGMLTVQAFNGVASFWGLTINSSGPTIYSRRPAPA